MKAIDFVVIASLILIFFLLLGDGGGGGKKGNSEDSAGKSETTESYFDEGLPEEFYPKEVSSYPNAEKLLEDLEYRRKRFEHSLDDEIREFEKAPGSPGDKKVGMGELKAKHQKARGELLRRHNELFYGYQAGRKEERERNKELR
ncbi:MAG TPA: hypothetical protein VNJ08_09705 [Bacteriovoracaceae bacterium]|nr:hypothetical protein [Bacteriovoracaceae bacterium]